MVKLWLLSVSMWALVAVACGGDDGGGGMTGDGTFGAECIMVSDTNNDECDSGVCTDSFDQIGHPVCSVKCTAGDGSTCPAGSEGMKCNGKGYCKP